MVRFLRRAIVALGVLFLAYLVGTVLLRPARPGTTTGSGPVATGFKWPEWLKRPSIVSSGFIYVGTEEGRPLYRVVAEELVKFDEGWFVLRGVRFSLFDAGGRSDSIEGEEARINQGKGLAELSGKVRFFGADGTVLHCDKVEIETRRRSARSPGPIEILFGGIAARAGSADIDTRGGTLGLSGGVFVDVERGEGAAPLSGISETAAVDRNAGTLELRGAVRVVSLGSFLEGGRLELRQNEAGKLRGFTVEQRVLATVGAAETGATEERVTHVSGERLVGTIGESGAVERLELESAGGAPAILFERTLQGSRQVEAAMLDARLADGRLSSADATGGVSFVERTDREKTLSARKVHVELAPGEKEPRRLEASGNVKLADGVRHASGERIVDVSTGDSVLEAAPGERASYEDDRIHLTAPRIAYRRADQWVRADGDVRGRLLPDPKRASAPLSDPGKPVFWSGRQLEASNTLGRAVLSGEARMWQEERLVKADRITLEDKDRVATCEKNVRAVIPDDPSGASPKSGPPRPPTIATGDRLVYREREATATLTGSAVVTSGDRKLTASELTVCLDPQRKVQRIAGAGGVTLLDAATGRRGEGAKLDYAVPEKKMVLEGSPGKEAWVEERGGNRVAGAVLIVEGEGERVRVRSAEGVRSTSTMTPKK